MASFKKYRNNKDGKLYWEFKGFLGTDEVTGEDVKVSRRRGENKLPFKTKKAAQDEYARLRVEFNEKKTKEREIKNRLTFKEVYHEWLNEYYIDSVKESTRGKTERWFNKYILNELGDLLITNITVDDCDKAVKKWSKGPLKDFRQLVQFVIRVFDYAVYKKYANHNPMKVCYIPATASTQPKREYFNKDELMIFLEETKKYGNGKKWHALFRLMAFTGARKGEVIALKWDDLDTRNKQIRFNKTLSKVQVPGKNNKVVVNNSTKNGKSRIISIDDSTIQVLKEYKEGSNDLMFPAESHDGYMHPDLVTTAMRRIIKKIDVNKDVSPHSLRHTHASLLFEAGLSIKDVQYRLGHSDTKITTEIYTHVTSARERHAVDTFTEFLNK